MAATRCDTLKNINAEDLQDAIWNVYLESFGDAATSCIQEQVCYDKAGFVKALLDQDYLKFVLHDDAKVYGFALATNNLEKARVAYVNPKRLEAAYPDYLGKIWYFTAIAIKPELQGKGLVAPLLDAIAIFIDGAGGLAAFDFSIEKNPMLPHLFTRAAKRAQAKFNLRTKSVEYTLLGGQQYGVVRLL